MIDGRVGALVPLFAVLGLDRPGEKDRDGCDELHSPPATCHANRRSMAL
jgi:hypothetical protein